MKKVDVSFVCDRCKSPLPRQFVSKNQRGDEYFDLAAYNRVSLGRGRRIAFNITVEIEFNPEYKELCPKCRLEELQDVVRELERQQREEASCTK